MARDMTKLRSVGGTLVVTFTQAILNAVDMKDGDRLLLEAMPPHRVMITKEVETMPSSRRVELELQVLERKRHALDKQADFVVDQNNLNMPCEPGMDEPSIVQLTLSHLNRDRANLDVEIAQKHLELFESFYDDASQGPRIPSISQTIDSIKDDSAKDLLSACMDDLRRRGFALRQTKNGRFSGFYRGERLVRLYPNQTSLSVRIKMADNKLGPRIPIKTVDTWQSVFDESVQPKMDEMNP